MGEIDGIRQMKCTACGREWLAGCYESSAYLECPDCGYMVSVEDVCKSGSTATAHNSQSTAITQICAEMDHVRRGREMSQHEWVITVWDWERRLRTLA